MQTCCSELDGKGLTVLPASFTDHDWSLTYLYARLSTFVQALAAPPLNLCLPGCVMLITAGHCATTVSYFQIDLRKDWARMVSHCDRNQETPSRSGGRPGGNGNQRLMT
jgi:hypothetical protein